MPKHLHRGVIPRGRATRWQARPLRRCGVTLIELIVVVGIVVTLASVLLPGLQAAKEQANGVYCRSNMRQLLIANMMYSEEQGGVYCPGAARFLENRNRWHGSRERVSEPFDPAGSPLATYLGPDGTVRRCPTFPAGEIARNGIGFERGCGGYGYNNAYVGVELRRRPSGAAVVADDQRGASRDRIARPARTVMFADSAFAAGRLVEYSFVEPRFHPQFPGFRMDPSIHFRHRGLANVGWCDGHVDAEPNTFTWSSGFYTGEPSRHHIGWFGKADDNSLFDLQ